MQENDSRYTPPSTDLLDASKVPSEYLATGPASPKLRLCGWLSLLYTFLLIPLFVLGFLEGMTEQSVGYKVSGYALELISMTIWVYFFLTFKQFINARFNFYSANNNFNLLITLTVASTLLTIVITAIMGVSETAGFIDLAVLVIAGVVMILLGRKLLKIEQEYKHLKLYAWLTLITGICSVTIILVLLVIPIVIASGVVLMLLFFHAANEIEQAEAGAHDQQAQA